MRGLIAARDQVGPRRGAPRAWCHERLRSGLWGDLWVHPGACARDRIFGRTAPRAARPPPPDHRRRCRAQSELLNRGGPGAGRMLAQLERSQAECAAWKSHAERLARMLTVERWARQREGPRARRGLGIARPGAARAVRGQGPAGRRAPGATPEPSADAPPGPAPPALRRLRRRRRRQRVSAGPRTPAGAAAAAAGPAAAARRRRRWRGARRLKPVGRAAGARPSRARRCGRAVRLAVRRGRRARGARRARRGGGLAAALGRARARRAARRRRVGQRARGALARR
jgi:hypothetical protein